MIDIDTLNEDSLIPPSKFTPDHKQVFMFSAITWNRHHVHYNKDAAIEEGLPDVVVQRGLVGNFMARHMVHWIGNQLALKKLSWLMRSSALPGEAIVCTGVIEKINESDGIRQIHCKLRVETDSQRIIAEGNSVLEG